MKTIVLIFGLLFSFMCTCVFSQEFSTLGEIYDFDPLDEFQYIENSCCNDVFFQLHKVKILERYDESVSIQYVRSTSLFSFVVANPPVLVDTIHYNIFDTLTILNPDSIIFINGDEIISNDSIYNGRKICVKHSNVMGKPKIDKYVNGCGLAVTSWYVPNDSSCRISDSLVYFKKEKEEWGENRFLSSSETKSNPELLIYPNPFHNILIIKLQNQNIKINIRLYSLTGKLILSPIVVNHYKKIHKLNLNHLKKGVYLLHINMVDKSQVYRIVKF